MTPTWYELYGGHERCSPNYKQRQATAVCGATSGAQQFARNITILMCMTVIYKALQLLSAKTFCFLQDVHSPGYKPVYKIT